MVKAYLRYKQQASFGVIASHGANIVYDESGQYIVAPALEEVLVWNVKKGTVVRKDVMISSSSKTHCWKEPDVRVEVSCIARAPNDNLFAIGYVDGSIRLWNMESEESLVTFNGHRGAVTSLCFDKDASRLASGSKDTEIVVWDVSEEVGLFRLRGHKNQVTNLTFLSTNGSNHLISSSADTLLRIWDLETRHCVESLIGHRNEVWSMAISPDETKLYTSAVDNEVKVWNLDTSVLQDILKPVQEGQETESAKAVSYLGSLYRTGKERSVMIKVHPTNRFIVVQGAEKSIDVFKVLDSEELKKKLARRKKRQKEKGGEVDELQPMDAYNFLTTIRTQAKVRSFDLQSNVHSDDSFSICASLTNNCIEQYQTNLPNKEEPTRLVTSIDFLGHGSDVRVLQLSSDDEMLLSGSNSGIKIWNVKTQQCIRSMESGYALCGTFLPGNKHVVIGTKAGTLQFFDLASSSMYDEIQAHEGALWSLQVRPDKKGLVTGSADKDVKFWDFTMENSQIKLIHMRTLKMSDDVLCVRYSPDQNLIAVSLLDATIKIFYHDTLKFFLSLYGHKLPVLSFDISSDNALLASVSADKTIKLWGLDFGDCHKSMIGHDDNIMACQFVWGTHYLFTVGKDRMVKYWDCDKYEMISKLQGHHGEVWALTVGKYGSIVVSGSHDRSIRIWQKTEEQLWLEEERERELEEAFERATIEAEDRRDQPIGSGVVGPDGTLPEIQRDESGLAGKTTAETLKSGEKIMEALDVWDSDRQNLDRYDALVDLSKKRNQDPPPLPQRNPYIIATGVPDMLPEQYVLKVVEKIRSSDLEEALLVLPFSRVAMLLSNVAFWIKKGWNVNLASKILFFLLKIHHSQITSHKLLRPTLEGVRKDLAKHLDQQRDQIGFNLAAAKFVSRQIQLNQSAGFEVVEEESTLGKQLPEGKKKKVVVRS